jgi:hypothetical protein
MKQTDSRQFIMGGPETAHIQQGTYRISRYGNESPARGIQDVVGAESIFHASE